MSKIEKIIMPIYAVDMHEDSPLPFFRDITTTGRGFDGEELDETDDLNLNDKVVCSIFPYSEQNGYDRKLVHHGVEAIVLENEFLRATFTPQWGGKLWSLYDKEKGKELLFNNHVYRPAYLALRNAWSSGGVEWNCGATVGHHPHTCDKMFTSIISKEESKIGCPVLRIYNYERIRGLTGQMDFYLPDGAKYLHCRMRVVNERDYETSVYWWSNIAVPTYDGARCVVPCDTAYSTKASVSSVDSEELLVYKLPVPNYNGIDITYPLNSPKAKDYFFKTKNERRKYIAHLDKDGYGLLQFSSSLLKGRKLFVWGTGKGADRWQEYLSGDDGHGKYSDGKYCEIQCGLARTQYEVVPMPAKHVFEWIEYYGALSVCPQDIHGDFFKAQETVEKALDNIISREQVEQELIDTREMATSKLGNMHLYGDGFASLENARREKANEQLLSEHLDFGKTDIAQEAWLNLLENKTLKTKQSLNSNLPPISYQRSKEWEKLMIDAVNGKDKDFWYTHYMLGCLYFSERKFDKAKEWIESSIKLEKNSWNTFVLGEIYRVKNDITSYAKMALSALKMNIENLELAKNAMVALISAKKWEQAIELYEALPEKLKANSRIKLYYAVALCEVGELDRSEELIYTENQAIEIPDIKEGELILSTLWKNIKKKKAARDNVFFDEKEVVVPYEINFSMLGN